MIDLAASLKTPAASLLAGYARTRTMLRHSPRVIRRLLVTTSGGMGDGILVGAIIQHLQRLRSDLTVGVLARFGAADALGTIARLQRHRWDGRPSWRIVRAIAKARYDAALAADHTALITAGVLCLAGVPRRFGFAPLNESPQPRLYTRSIQLDESKSQWTLLVQLARLIEPEMSEQAQVLAIPVTDDIESEVERWWNGTIGNGPGRVVAMHLGAGNSYRRWPVESFVALTEQLRERSPQLKILLTGRDSERDAITIFRRASSAATFDLLGFDNLIVTTAALRRCDLLVSADCGVMHLGASIGTPTIGLFGPNSPLQWAPQGPRATFVWSRTPPCSPCIHNYRGPAPPECTYRIASQCMKDISVSSVVEAARRVTGGWLN